MLDVKNVDVTCKLFVLTAVKGIKKQHLVDVRTFNNPPQAVKLAIESICTLLGEKDLDWKSMRGIIIKDNFIPTIINFDTENLRYVELLSSSMILCV